MFTAYFDESGNATDKNGTFAVGGGLSTNQKWLRLETQWRQILKEHGIKVFHMQECAAGTGEYKGWSSDDRRTLVADLSECIARNMKHAFGVTILLEGWSRVNEDFQLAEIHGHPYSFCGRFAGVCVRAWMKRRGYSAPVRYIFEDGAKGKGQLIDHMSLYDGVTPGFDLKGQPGLQAADLVAWKIRRIVHHLVKYPYSMTAAQLKSSLLPVSRIPRKYWVFDERELLVFCKRHNVPPR